MIGYVTLGSQRPREIARNFYDALMPAVGAGRIMEFGDNFTMYGTGMGKPGLAVCKPYDGNPATAGNGNMASIVVRQPRPRSTRFTPRRWSSAAAAKARPEFAATRARSAFYGAYFRDLDGNKLAAFRIGPAD